MSAAFDRLAALVTPEIRKYTSKTLDIVDHIHSILERKGMSQKDLAELLEKQPSEVSRWLTGLHNFEMKTLVKIEVALGEEVILVNDATHAVASELAASISDLPSELQAEALSFIQYLKQKSGSSNAALGAENQSVAKKAKPYPKQKEVADMLREDDSAPFAKTKKRTEKS
jgi:transcriptional regulator with XRE-family HTH domain